MNILFFGDSLTAGENSQYKYTDFLPKKDSIQNLAVSGTTIGEYSIYPVDGNSLLSQISKHTEDIQDADVIYIEYGANDISSVMCGFATLKTVIISLVKSLDWIHQLNNKAKVIFLALGNDKVLLKHSERMCKYLENDYFKSFGFSFPITVYLRMYKHFINDVKKICPDVKYMFDDAMVKDMSYLSDDGIHPNAKGHQRIAENISK